MRLPIGAVATFRGPRVRSCGYKPKHWTIQGAGAHLDSIRRFGPRTDRLTVCRCRRCGAWHVGRQKVEANGGATSAIG